MRGVILRLVRIPLVILSALTRNKEVNMKWSGDQLGGVEICLLLTLRQ